MNLSRCPKCNEELGRIEQLDGRCSNCGAEFPKGDSVTHGELEDSPYHPSASDREPLTTRQKACIGLLLAFLLTLLTPWGLIWSCWIGLQKGDTLCADAGCTREATKKVEYGLGVSRGYCEQHGRKPDESISTKQLKMPYILCILGLLFIGHFVMAFKEGYTGKTDPPTDPTKKPHDPYRYFYRLTIISIVGVNGIFWFLARYLC